ncbi:MAG: hypothetical protein QNJ12_12375 [Ilumatobacter sp.]|uniref:hypothetical protein n=1 Tax=Ilumatobacter sp. TaxID=1967498 RepID=UPI002634C61C|nr:hypothetical protein [Ilumatobacter sp.]MDJ0769588.1 hypothetical protein [Ilumatobacter sp.]
MARPTSAEVRERLLEAGIAVVLRQLGTLGDSSPIAHIDLKAVATEAGYASPGMIYTAWTDKTATSTTPRESYIRELTERLIDMATSNSGIEAYVANVVASGAPLDEAIRLGANFSLGQELDDHDGWSVHTALRELPQDSELSRRFVDAEVRRTRELSSMYDDALEHFGRRYKPGIDGNQIALMLRAFEYGLWASIRLAPDIAQVDDLSWVGRDGWSLYAVAARELLMGLTEPLDEPGSEAGPTEARDDGAGGDEAQQGAPSAG